MEIYADPITVNCRKVLAGLKLLEVDYTLVKVDYFMWGPASPWRMSPDGSAPEST